MRPKNRTPIQKLLMLGFIGFVVYAVYDTMKRQSAQQTSGTTSSPPPQQSSAWIASKAEYEQRVLAEQRAKDRAKQTPTPSRDIVQSGEIGVLRAGDSTSSVILGSDKEAYDELTKTFGNHDQEGFAMLMLSGRAFAVPAGTKVRVLDTLFSFGFLPTSKQVRVLEGEYYGRVGLVPNEWVVPASSIEPATPEIRKAKPVL